jgi:hypothetical protein
MIEEKICVTAEKEILFFIVSSELNIDLPFFRESKQADGRREEKPLILEKAQRELRGLPLTFIISNFRRNVKKAGAFPAFHSAVRLRIACF